MEYVKLPSGKMHPIAGNQTPYHLKCPIDGTQLAAFREEDFRGYECYTCNMLFKSRRDEITQEQLANQARTTLSRIRKKIADIDVEKSRLLGILKLSEENKFS